MKNEQGVQEERWSAVVESLLAMVVGVVVVAAAAGVVVVVMIVLLYDAVVAVIVVLINYSLLIGWLNLWRSLHLYDTTHTQSNNTK